MFDAIGSFLTHQFAGSKGDRYGWELVLGYVVFPLCAAVVAWELRQRRARTQREAGLAATARVLTAALLIEEDARQSRVDGRIELKEGLFSVSIVDARVSPPREELHQFSTIIEVETFLSAHTPLRLGDFK
jgi:hypothetical protein